MSTRVLNAPTDEIIVPSGNMPDACLLTILMPTFERIPGNDAIKNALA
jgi:hypothetical protein